MSTDLGAEVERLSQLAIGALGAGGDMRVLEVAVRTAMTQLGGALLEGLLGADRGYRGPRVDCGAGHQARFVGYRDKTITTVVGPVGLSRAYYHCRPCRAGVVPRDGELGVAGRSTSPGLGSMLARAGAALPFAQARDLVGHLAGIDLSAKRVERATKSVGAAAQAVFKAQNEAIVTKKVIPLVPGPVPDMCYIAIDGTGVPMRPDETAGRAGKGPDGRARTREVKLAAVFTQTDLDEQGYPIRDPGSTSYVATFDPAADFGRLAKAETRRRGADQIRQLVVLGDGAPWIWNLAATHWPEATQVVDLFHAREHLHEIAAMVAPTLGDDLDTWVTDRLAELDAGEIETMLAEVYKPLPKQGKVHALDKALPYFQVNAHRMRYGRFRELGMFVGSGVVEAGCKTVIGQRLKLSGMRWSIPGATATMALRCAEGSNRWDEICHSPHNQITAA